MLADYFTKPLQGKLFRRFREVIMGYIHINDLLLDPTFPLKERVENRDKIVIENMGVNNMSSEKMTYAQIVRNKKEKPKMSVRRSVRFVGTTDDIYMDEIKSEKNNQIE